MKTNLNFNSIMKTNFNFNLLKIFEWHSWATIEEQELKQQTTAVPACYVPVCLKKKHNACKAVWFTKATVLGVGEEKWILIW